MGRQLCWFQEERSSFYGHTGNRQVTLLSLTVPSTAISSGGRRFRKCLDPVSACGSVWDSELAPGQGPERPCCRDGSARTTGHQPCAVAVTTECLISVRVTKGPRLSPGHEGPGQKGLKCQEGGACRRYPVSPQAQESGSWQPAVCRWLGPCSVPCPDREESSYWAGPSMTCPKHLRGHGSACRTPLRLPTQWKPRAWLLLGCPPVRVCLTAPSPVVRQTRPLQDSDTMKRTVLEPDSQVQGLAPPHAGCVFAELPH